ncbi:MAG: NAD(P)/FAD-dependent oxidoreductase [Candidatus Electrothrix sp. GW3-4]|uniref:NAD(P)/FAD-dependent oxidoreductase n=1 Tax=Candidatus Electrothrix sp. GW3-4 TaxID=3126740 RepID=UPI0030D3B3BD
MNRILVIGGGAAGMMAAGQAAAHGAEVVLLEKMPRPGKKIAISGKGRCNLSNSADLPEFINHFGRNGRFLRQAFQDFFNKDLIRFFQEQGLELITERGGRIFPAQGRAPDVVKTLRQWLEGLSVSLRPDSPVERLLLQDGKITGALCNGNPVYGKAVILATGGASYPATGSSGDGYRLAESIGHSIVPIRPGLVPVITQGNLAARLSGLHLRNVGVRLTISDPAGGKKKQKKQKKLSAFGELQFMKYGLSGPVILTLSNEIVDGLRADKQVHLVLDLKPALDDQKLDARLQRDFLQRHKEPMQSVLRGLMPEKLVRVCLDETGLAPDRLAGEIRAEERKRLRFWLKNIPLTITGYRGFKEAIITCGGVSLKEVDPRTMGSKCCPGLYLAGELLDLQADTGGYNLQAAFSTGWLAGRSAAEYCNKGLVNR